MSLKIKLLSMVSAFILVLSMLLVGVLAATQTINLKGTVSFNISDRTLYLKDMRIQTESTGQASTADNFMPGFINEDIVIDLGTIESSSGSVNVYFDFVNTTSTTYQATATGGSGVGLSTSGQISGDAISADQVATYEGISGTITLTIQFTGSTLVNLDGIMLTFEEYSVYERVDEDGTPNPEGNYLLFGWYPQTIKANDVTIVNETQPESNGYYLGSDGAYYMKATAKVDSYLESGYANFSDDTAIASGTEYYFKMEPLKWRILTENYNGTSNALIVCDTAVDMVDYRANYKSSGDYYYATDEGGTIITDPTATVGQGVDSNHQVYANNYEYSEIREYLNDTFYNTAFNAEEKFLIVTTTVDNSLDSIFGSYKETAGVTEENFPYACRDTEDNVFLLSRSDVNNTEYGYKDSYGELERIDSARYFYTSDYSKAMGVRTITQEMFDAQMGGMEELFGEGIIGSSTAWLRSPSDIDHNYSTGAFVVYYGDIVISDVISYLTGVVPALQIKLS